MMRLPNIDYYAPPTGMEACSLLDRYGAEARVMAGGTDFLVACKLRNIRPRIVISLSNIKELKGIRLREEELRIGTMTSLWDVRCNPIVVNRYPALAEAAAAVGTVQLQHMGTIGGNLCLNTRCIYYNQSESWRKSRSACLKMGGDVCHVIPKGGRCYAVFSGDIAPILIALNARVRLVSSAGDRVVDACDLYTGDSREPIAVKSGEVLAEIRLPRPITMQKSTYLKFRLRGAIDFPLAGVAVRMDSEERGVCTGDRVVVTGVGSAPMEIAGAGELLKGRRPTVQLLDQVAETARLSAHPVANVLGSTPTYRRKMVGILTRRAFLTVANELDLIQES